MTIAEFHDAVRQIAGRQHCATKVEVAGYSNGSDAVVWSAYTEFYGWTRSSADPRAVLAELLGGLTTAYLESLGSPPEAGVGSLNGAEE